MQGFLAAELCADKWDGRSNNKDMSSSPASRAAEASRYFILGTAGHIDHGKSMLVKALRRPGA